MKRVQRGDVAVKFMVGYALVIALTVLLGVPVAIGLARAGKRGALDRFEQEQVEFFERVRQAYLELAARHDGRYRVIDANQPLAGVQQQLDEVLRPFMDVT